MLSVEKIIEHLNTLQEHKMAKDIFVPVLKSMTCKGVRFTGGSNEQGIDIEYYELTHPENYKSYVGIQFKKGDLIYSARGTKNSIKDIKNQAEEAFDKGIPSENAAEIHYIGRFIVATTGIINEKAREMINKAKLKGADRRINYWDGEKLAEYIQDYWLDEFIDYFGIIEEDETLEPEIDNVVDSDYIENNYNDLIKKCVKVKLTVSGLEWDILDTMVKLKMFNDQHRVAMSDLLFELEKEESYLEYELTHLIRLNYIEIDEDNDLYLKGHANNLINLAQVIIDEIYEAEEDVDIAEGIYSSIL